MHRAQNSIPSPELSTVYRFYKSQIGKLGGVFTVALKRKAESFGFKIEVVLKECLFAFLVIFAPKEKMNEAKSFIESEFRTSGVRADLMGTNVACAICYRSNHETYECTACAFCLKNNHLLKDCRKAD